MVVLVVVAVAAVVVLEVVAVVVAVAVAVTELMGKRACGLIAAACSWTCARGSFPREIWLNTMW